jgi:phosphoribosylformylglycinamidine cyclo-ligase
MAHITGGGLIENIPRILPEGLGAVIERSWNPQAIFPLMQRIGNIEEYEMHRAFNMGVGLVIVGTSGLEPALSEAFQQFHVWKLGHVDSAIHGVLINWGKR